MIKILNLVIFCILFVIGCNGSSEDVNNAFYNVGGSVIGLSGTLVVQKNNTDDLIITSNGSFSFPTQQRNGEFFSITIKSAPVDQNCTVSNGSGTIAGSDALSAKIFCGKSYTNIKERLNAINFYLIYYGIVDEEIIEQAKKYQLVILHPLNANITRETVQQIQQGLDPDDPWDDVLVIGYISVGEDLRTAKFYDPNTRTFDYAGMQQDSRFVDDGTGPAIDPRGNTSYTVYPPLSMDGINQTGALTNGGFAPWYVNDNAVHCKGDADGLPDINIHFGGLFVNAGHPRWYDVLDNMKIDGVDENPGIQEILTLDTGRGLGFDGLFLDTIDTAAPNFFTNGNCSEYYSETRAFNMTQSEWTGPGFTSLIKKIKENYPDKLILQNRGLFFYNPSRPHFQFSPRQYIDLFLFESFRLNSNSSETYNSYYYPDNKFNIAPKLMAEANRPDGFKVISLGYADGPGMSYETLSGNSDMGYDDLIADITETHQIGFRHYITNGAINIVNEFVLNNAQLTDNEPPTWSNTYNANIYPWPTPPEAPNPRIGIQKVTAGYKNAVVHWDVALDLNKVEYALYYQKTPFDFIGDPNLTGATRVILIPEMGDGYINGAGVDIYAYKATVSNLDGWTEYYFLIRAFDDFSEQNEFSLSATIYGD